MFDLELKTTNDTAIIKDETNELREITEYHSERKITLIKSAAEKLADKYEDTTVIGTKLCNAWKDLNISKSYILLALPANYKRAYTRDKIPPNKVSEHFKELRNLMYDLGNIFQSWSKKCLDPDKAKDVEMVIADIHKMHEHAEQAYLELQKELSNIRHFSELHEKIKIWRHEVVGMQELLDERYKYTVGWKFALKWILFYKSYDHVASMLVDDKKYGAKWVSKIDSDPILERLMNTIGKCPKCNWNWTAWMQRASKRLEKGIEEAPSI